MEKFKKSERITENLGKFMEKSCRIMQNHEKSWKLTEK